MKPRSVMKQLVPKPSPTLHADTTVAAAVTSSVTHTPLTLFLWTKMQTTILVVRVPALANTAFRNGDLGSRLGAPETTARALFLEMTVLEPLVCCARGMVS